MSDDGFDRIEYFCFTNRLGEMSGAQKLKDWVEEMARNNLLFRMGNIAVLSSQSNFCTIIVPYRTGTSYFSEFS